MRGFFSGIDAKSYLLCALLLGTAATFGQEQNPTHVVIPNPTPRPPDLKQEFGDTPADQKKREAVSLENQLRAREIWLESNQILLLAQQLQQEIVSDKKSKSMATDTAKVAQIEKLAHTLQEKMKTQ
ncbi:MAG: hypothetical protein WCA10_19225 [Terracidiphilus sp.]